MKKHLPSILPALALFTLGGCAASSNLAVTETDGMYYSAADQVTAAAVPVAPQPGPDYASGDVINPDYNGSTARNRGGNEYYDDDYYATPRRNNYNNYRGGSLGLGYYSFPYADPFFYGAPVIAYSPYSSFGYSPYGFYDPFYRPFYGYGGLTINLGFGFGRGYYRPFGYGPGYDPYFGYGGFGNPYRGWGNRFGGGYGGYGNGYYNNGYYGNGFDRQPSNTAGVIRSRGGNTAVQSNAGVSSPSVSAGRGRVVQQGGFATQPNSGSAAPNAAVSRGRSRVVPSGTSEGDTYAERNRNDQTIQGSTRTTSSEPAPTTRRWRVLDNSASNGGGATYGRQQADGSSNSNTSTGRQRQWDNNIPAPTTTTTAPQAETTQPRRGRSYGGSSRDSYTQPERSYSQPERSSSQPERSYSQPERSYSAPQRSSSESGRSYSAPSRSSSPASSSPASSGSSGGGGRGRVR